MSKDHPQQGTYSWESTWRERMKSLIDGAAMVAMAVCFVVVSILSIAAVAVGFIAAFIWLINIPL